MSPACLLSALAALCTAVPACAQPAAMPDTELGEVWGQALLSLSNTQQGGLDFSRLTVGGDLRLSVNFTQLRLGEYTATERNGSGADIDLGALRFGRSDAGESARTVTLNNPYLEFVWSGSGNTRQVLGMRIGAEGVSGAIGLQMNSVSGSVLIDAGSAGTVDSRNDPLGGKRWDGRSCVNPSACTVSLAQVGGVQAGNADGASRDFFLSVLRQAVVFPAVGTAPQAPDAAQAGFWLNWRDRLSAINTSGLIPPNASKAGP